MKILTFSLSFALVSSMYATTLSEIKNSTLQNNQTLKIYNSKIDISKQNELLSLKWSNIILGIGANDILINDISARDKEAMQTQFITLSQVIPTASKKQHQQKIQHTQTTIYKLLQDDKKSNIYSKIMQNLNDYILISKKIKLLKKIKLNIKDIRILQNQRFKTTSIAQIDIVKSNTKYLNVILQIQQLQSLQKLIKIDLQNISYKSINNIEYTLPIYKLDIIKIQKTLINNNMYKALKLKTLKYEQNIKLQEAKKTADIKLNVGYYQREAFDDYVAFSINYPLSIYGSENIKINKAKQEVIQSKVLLNEFKNEFTTKILNLQQNQNIAYTNYGFIKEQIIPNKEYILNILVSNSSQNQINTLKQLKLKNEILKDELRALNELQKFYKTKAKLAYYKGQTL